MRDCYSKWLNPRVDISMAIAKILISKAGLWDLTAKIARANLWNSEFDWLSLRCVWLISMPLHFTRIGLAAKFINRKLSKGAASALSRIVSVFNCPKIRCTNPRYVDCQRRKVGTGTFSTGWSPQKLRDTFSTSTFSWGIRDQSSYCPHYRI